MDLTCLQCPLIDPHHLLQYSHVKINEGTWAREFRYNSIYHVLRQSCHCSSRPCTVYSAADFGLVYIVQAECWCYSCTVIRLSSQRIFTSAIFETLSVQCTFIQCATLPYLTTCLRCLCKHHIFTHSKWTCTGSPVLGILLNI